MKRISILLAFLFFVFSFFTSSASALVEDSIESSIDSGSQWLEANQNGDGSWGNIPHRDTATAVKALLKSKPESATIINAEAWLASTDTLNNDYLARKIGALQQVNDVLTLSQLLLTQQQADGGFGLSSAYQSNVLDTALALESLVNLNLIDQLIVDKAATYLVNAQNNDGGWSLIPASESNVKTTALALAALSSYRRTYAVKSYLIADKISAAVGWLASNQNSGGAWGNPVSETALAVSALSAADGDTAAYESGVAYILGNQAPDGSWNQNPYDTALAILALESPKPGQRNNTNLRMDSLTLSSSETGASTPVVLTANVRNTGGTPVEMATVKFYLSNLDTGKTLLAEQMIHDLAPGDLESVKYVFNTAGKIGEYQLIAQIDPENLLTEANEDDNQASANLTIYSKPTAPQLIDPSNDALLKSSPGSFSWYNAQDLSGFPLTYEVQIDRTPAFSSPDLMIHFEAEQPFITMFDLPMTLADGVWYWRAAASNGYTAGPWSTTRSFTIDSAKRSITNLTAVPDPFAPSYWSAGTTIFYTLDGTAGVEIAIEDQTGRTVRHLGKQNGYPGTNIVNWNGLDNWQQFAPDGTYRYVVTATTPAGEVSSASGSVVVDATPPKISELAANPSSFSPNVDSGADETAITYRLSEAATVSIRVFKNTDMIRVLEKDVSRTGDFHGVSWDGKDDSGRIVQDGNYNIVVSAEDKAGNWAIEQNALIQVDTRFGSIGPISLSPNPAFPGDRITVAAPIQGAISTVTVEIDDRRIILEDIDSDQVYTAATTAPEKPGDYPVMVRASNGSGQVLEEASQVLKIASSTIKTRSWKETSQADFFQGSRNKIDAITSPGDLLLSKNPWEYKTPMPSFRSDFGIVEKDAKIYVIGGSTRPDSWTHQDGEPSALLEIYDPATDSWQSGPSMPTPRRFTGAAPGIDGKIYVFGGYKNHGVYADNVEVYDPETQLWEARRPMPFTRSCFAVQAGIDGKIYVFGGHVPTPDGLFMDETATVQAYDPLTDTWETKTPMPSRRARMASTVGLDGKIYLIGGVIDFASSKANLTKVEKYDPLNDQWENMPDLQTPRRWPAAATVAANGDIYVIGGYGQSGDLDRVEALTPGESSWRLAPSLNLGRSYLGAASLRDGRIFAIGGIRVPPYSDIFFLNKVEVYDTTRIYPASGEYISSVKDIGRQSVWGSINWTADLPTGTGVEFQTQSSVNNIDWSEWSSPYATSGSQITSPPGRYIRYKVKLKTADYLITPKLSDVTINYNSVPGVPMATDPAGEYTSDQTPVLTWKNADDPEGDELLYTLELDTVPTFDSPDLKRYSGIKQSSGSTSVTISEDGRLAHGSTWYWRVNASDGRLTGAWSVPKILRVDLLPPALSNVSDWPDPFSPNANGAMDNTTISFDLSEEANASLTLYDWANVPVRTLNLYGNLAHAWQPRAQVPDTSGRSNAEAFKLSDGRVLLVGGLDVNGKAVTKPSVYEPATNTWQERSPMPQLRYKPAIAKGSDGRIYVMGGYDSPFYPYYPTTTVQIYDPESDSWTSGPSLPQGISEGKAERIDDKIYVFGGSVGNPWNVKLIYNLSTGKWQSLTSPTLPGGSDPVAYQGKLYLIGGYYTDSVYIYDPVGNTWKNGAPTPVSASYSYAATVVGSDGLIYAIGRTSRVDVYDPVSDRWTVGATLPSGKSSTAAVLVGNEILFFGGGDYYATDKNQVLSYLVAGDSSEGRKRLIWDGLADNGSLVPDGIYTYKVTATDAAGNKSVVKNGTVTVDNTAPTISDIKIDTALLEPGTPLLVTARIDGDPAKVTATLDNTSTIMFDTDGGGLFAAQLSAIENGSHRLTIQAEDEAGNDQTVSVPATTPGSTVPPFWSQTSQADFLLGGPSGLDILSSPGYLQPAKTGWQQTTNLSSPRSYSRSAVDEDGKVHVIGGYGTANQALGAHEVYDPATNRWESKASLPNVRYDFGALAGADGRIYVFGGRYQNSSFGTTLSQVYDPKTDTWQTISPMPVATYGNSAVLIDGKIYVVGHYTSEGVWIQSYDPSTNKWENLGSQNDQRSYYSVAAVGNKIYVIGGRSAGYTGLNKSYDVTAKTWQTLTSMPTPRGHAATVVDNRGKIWIIGGALPNASEKVEVFDPQQNRWFASESLPAGRYGAAASYKNGIIYLFGGRNSLNNSLSEVTTFRAAREGSLTSSVFDAGDIVAWKTIGWTALLPEGTNIRFAARSSTDAVNWSDWSSWITDSGDFIAGPAGRYLQYRASLSSEASWVTPVLSDVIISYEQTKPKAPTLETPSSGQELTIANPTFTWQNSQHDPDKLFTYRLQVDRSADFDSPDLRNYEAIAEGDTKTDFDITDRFLADGGWYWRVAAGDGERQSDWSPTQSFTINTRPDFKVDEISVTPATLSEPDTATVSAVIRNLGADAGGFNVFFYDGDPAFGGRLIGAKAIGGLPAGGAAPVEIGYKTFNQAGIHSFYAVVDPEDKVDERLETNNIAAIEQTIEPHNLELGVNLDKASVGADETLTINVLIGNNSNITRDALLNLSIIDDQGGLVAELGSISLANLYPSELRITNVVWNAGRVYAGNYRVQAELIVAGYTLAAAVQDFIIEPDTRLELKTNTDRLVYAANENVKLTSRLTSQSRNYIFRDLAVEFSISDSESSQTIFYEDKLIPQLLPDELARLAATWNTGQNQPGVYQASASVKNAGGAVLASADTSFTIQSTADTGAGLNGHIDVSNPQVVRWNPVDFNVSLANNGNSTADFTAKVIIADPESGQILKEIERPVSLQVNETTNTMFNYPFVDLPEGKSYLAILKAQLSGAEPTLDHTNLTVARPLDVSARTDGESLPRVLVWAASEEQETLAVDALKRAGAFYRIIKAKQEGSDEDEDNKHGQDEFRQALRSGVFSQYWIIGGSHPLEDHAGEELTEKVNAGATLFIAGEDALHKLTDELRPEDDNVLGLKVRGNLGKSTYTVNMLGSTVTDTDTISVTDKPAKLELSTAQTLGTITMTKGKKTEVVTAAALNEYGLGRAVTLGFDPTAVADKDDQAVKSLLEKIIALPAPDDRTASYGIVPLQINLDSLGAAAKLRTIIALPENMQAIYAVYGSIATNTVSFDVDLAADESRTLELAARLPKVAGTSTVTVSTFYFSPEEGSYKPYATLETTLTVARDLTVIVQNVQNALETLAVGDNNRQRIENIKRLIDLATQQQSADYGDVDDNDPISLILKAIADLRKIEADTGDIRLNLDAVLSIFEVDWTLSQLKEDEDEQTF